MNLSHRERSIAITAVAALLLLGLDRYALSPVLEARERIQAETQRLTAEMEEATSLFKRGKLVVRRWRDMTEKGLTEDPAEAESQVLHAVRNWSEETGLALSSVKPERLNQGDGVRQITFRAAGTGTMRAVGRFLWQMETADIPLRIHELQLGSRTEGRDDLSLQLRFSTLYAPAVERGPAAPGAAAAKGGEEP